MNISVCEFYTQYKKQINDVQLFNIYANEWMIEWMNV